MRSGASKFNCSFATQLPGRDSTDQPGPGQVTPQGSDARPRLMVRNVAKVSRNFAAVRQQFSEEPANRSCACTYFDSASGASTTSTRPTSMYWPPPVCLQCTARMFSPLRSAARAWGEICDKP